MTEDRFRLPASSYEQVTKIVMAYGSNGGPVSPPDVAKTIGINVSTISANNAFLLGVGILEGTRQKSLSAKGRSLSRALEYDNQVEIERCWAEILSPIEFIQKMLSAVRIRRGMDRSSLQSHIAYSAGLTKSEIVLRGANTIIDIAAVAGLLAEEDGKYIVNNVIRPLSNHDNSNNLDLGENGKAPAFFPPQATGMTNGSSNIPVSIQIQLRCDASELEGLGAKLRALIKELSQDNDGQDEFDHGSQFAVQDESPLFQGEE